MQQLLLPYPLCFSDGESWIASKCNCGSVNFNQRLQNTETVAERTYGRCSENVDFDGIIDKINSVEGVEDAHHIHIWSITSGVNAMSAHIVVNGMLNVHETQKIIQRLEERMKHESIDHVTVQVECKHHDHDDEILCN